MRYVHHRHHISERHHKHKGLNRFVTLIMWTVAILAPFSTLPQIIDIYATRRVSGLSGLTWFLFIISPLIWLSYGILHKDKFIIVNNMLWVLFSGIVFTGIMLYR